MTIVPGKFTFKGLEERAKVDMLKAGRQVKESEGDIQPQVYFYIPSGGERLHHTGVPFEAFCSEEGKDELVARIKILVNIGPATLVALTITSYLSVQAARELNAAGGVVEGTEFGVREGVTMPSQQADRQEGVMLIVFDAEIVKGWWCPIKRTRSRPPQYGPWEPTLSDLGGRMVTPIQQVMR